MHSLWGSFLASEQKLPIIAIPCYTMLFTTPAEESEKRANCCGMPRQALITRLGVIEEI